VPPDDRADPGEDEEVDPPADLVRSTTAARPTASRAGKVRTSTMSRSRRHRARPVPRRRRRLITESLKDYTRKTVRKTYASLDAFLTAWNDADRKQAILEELVAKGVFLDELAEQVGRDYDAFDLVCHVAFDQPPLTRRRSAPTR
jgi:type I site-specific restriction endonuclease